MEEKRNVYDVLLERGFIAQATHADEIRDMLGKESVTFYIGYDPTADSLHAGSFLAMMAMAHMQRAGHRPIVLLGGGTAMVGDPSGKSDMRKMLTVEDISYNASRFKKQFETLLDFSDGKALMVNNADWLLKLNYVELLREIGVHFSVNRMLSAECFKLRLEKGLSFLEFNYMIMQSYDFLELYRMHGCKLQCGGDDQWSNIIYGADLIRRKEGASAYGLTFKLLTMGEGAKMGKTEKGAVWLDPAKTSPYEFYQYWRNIGDLDVKNCLSLFTFLPMDEVNRLGDVEGAALNEAKKVLAFEITKIIHGEEEAVKAREATEALFSGGADSLAVPTTLIAEKDFVDGMGILDLLVKINMAPSKGEGRRLVQQGGIHLNGEKMEDFNKVLFLQDFADGKILIKKGKKSFHKIELEK